MTTTGALLRTACYSLATRSRSGGGSKKIKQSDLQPVFTGHPEWVFKYDGHWNSQGHAAVANAIAPVLAGMLN